MAASPEPAPVPGYSLTQFVLYALKLGAIGFGGPVALVGYMHRDLVEERKWISEADYKEGLTLSQLMPGPLAAQLMIYLAAVTVVLLWKCKKLPEPVIVAGAALVGLAVYPLMKS